MKILAPVYVVCLCAVLGFARPDGENTLSEGEVLCPTTGDEDRAITFEKFRSMIDSCVIPDEEINSRKKLQANTTIEDVKELVRAHCVKAPIFQECIVGIKEIAARCLADPVEIDKLEVRANLMKKLVEVACLQDGVRAAAILHEMALKYNKTNISFLYNCVRRTSEAIDTEAATVSQYSLQQYQMLTNLKKCLVDYKNSHEVGLEDMMAILNETADVLTCVGEDSAEPILCKTLTAQRCVAHDSELDDTAQQLYNTYLRELVDCHSQDENSSSIVNQFKEARTTEEYQHIFKGFCNVSASERKCLANTYLNGGLCLHGRFLNMFRGGFNVITMTRHMICEDEGHQLPSILAAVRAAATTSDNFAERCFNAAALEGFKDEAGWNDNHMLVHYQVLTNLKNCIADYGRDHNQAAVDLASFVGEHVEELTCFGYINGNFVHCSTLLN